MTAETRRGGLGRGLSALIPQRDAVEAETEIALRDIVRNPYQPRKRIDREALEQLADSIAEHGVLQPVLVTKTDEGYQLVAGERRVRAAEMAGLERVPALVRLFADRDRLAVALVENIQRADLNALEEAHAYRQLIDEFGLSHEEVARRVGRSRPTVSNTLRLLDLPAPAQEAVAAGTISEGHARAIAGAAGEAQQQELLKVVVGRGLSVRQTEELARRLGEGAPAPRTRAPSGTDPELEQIESGLRTVLGTKVRVTPGPKGGRITIEYYDGDDLGRLVELLTAGRP